jgi:hypothetical protein
MNLKEGLIQIRMGFGTLFSPITKALAESAKPGGKLHVPKVGLTQIAQGVKHIFGKTEEQKTAALYKTLLATVPAHKQEIILQLLKNADGYSRMDGNVMGKMSRVDYLSLIRDIFVMSAVGNFVGIQPMEGPVGLSYFLRFTAVDHVDVEGKRMVLQIVKQTATAGTRRLQARFTTEAVQDLAAIHIDAVNEFHSILAKQIAAEIDNEFFTDMCDVAKEVKQEDGATLALTINRASNDMARNTRRGAARFVIVNVDSLLELQMDPKSNFVSVQGGGNDWSFKKVGVLNNMSVFLTPLALDGKAVIGYKGGGMFNDEVDAGLVFNPYVPLMSSGVVIDPNTFEPQITLMTRYGKSFISKEDMSNYYTRIV